MTLTSETENAGEILTLGRAGGMQPPISLFLEWLPNDWNDAGWTALKLYITYEASFEQLLAKELTGSGQVTEL